jgi:L,D-transpeptidase catalytic domain
MRRLAALGGLLLLAAPPAQSMPMRHSTGLARTDGTSLVAHVRPGHLIALRTRPNGPSVGILGSRTVYGSRLALPVVETRGSRWLGIVSAAMPNGRLGWIDAQAGALAFKRVRITLEADLSRRLLRAWAGGRVVRRIRIGVGRAGSRTPTGRFSITDKLRGREYGSDYGCCILALSGHQPNTPRG